MSEPNYEELLRVYNEDTQTVIQKIRADINEDELYKRLEEEYNVYDILMFNEFNLQEKIERSAFHLKDFRLKFLQETAKYEQLQDHLGKVTGQKYQDLKEGSVSLTKTEIEKYYLPKDEELLRLKALIRKQEARCKYFESVWSALEKQTWHIKMWIENGKGGF